MYIVKQVRMSTKSRKICFDFNFSNEKYTKAIFDFKNTENILFKHKCFSLSRKQIAQSFNRLITF